MSRVADLLMEQGAIAARARELSGQTWGNAVANIASVPAQLVAQHRQEQDDALRRAEMSTRVQLGQQALAKGAQEQKDITTVDQLWADPSVYNADGTLNRAGLQQKLNAGNAGHLWPHVAGLADTLDEGRGKILDQQTKLYVAHQEALGNAALKIEAGGNDPDSFKVAVTDLSRPDVGVLTKDQANRLMQLSTPQQIADVLKAWKAGTKADEAEYKIIPEGGTLAKTLPGRQTTTVITSPAKRTEVQAALDAYAKSIGKTNAEELTDADRQAYEQRELTSKSKVATAQHASDRNYDVAHPIPEKSKSQDALEQEYRTVLTRAMSNRSGGIGIEDAKVQQANHLVSIFEQNYDPKTGDYNIPRVQLNELALGLARLTAPGGQAGEQMLKEFQQRTAKGDLAGALTYLSGQPIASNTQAITQMLKESIERQGRTAETNRDGELSYLRGQAPTDLEETRRLALEKNNLNPLRQVRVAVDVKGVRRMFVSTDGGKTWK